MTEQHDSLTAIAPCSNLLVAKMSGIARYNINFLDIGAFVVPLHLLLSVHERQPDISINASSL